MVLLVRFETKSTSSQGASSLSSKGGGGGGEGGAHWFVTREHETFQNAALLLIFRSLGIVFSMIINYSKTNLQQITEQ